jgi:hypothetical protein
MNNTIWSGIVISFVITALFDLALNLLHSPIGATRIRPYFEQHTPLAAALIAGFVGAVTFTVLFAIYSGNPKPNIYNIAVIFSVSALIGIPMRYSGLFPHLDKHYYQVFPRIQSFIYDGGSGIMVALVYYYIMRNNI